MKRLILCFGGLVWRLPIRPVAADEPSSVDHVLDGRAWLRLSEIQKFMYYRGMWDMMVSASHIAKANDRIELADSLRELIVTELSYREIQAALDAFYANPSNVRVPIVAAFKWIKLRGEERDAEAARLRAMYPKDGK